MESSQIIEELRKKFPQFPNPRHWDQYNHDRYYFNKTENNTDFTFYIDFTRENKVFVNNKKGCTWYPNYPPIQEVIRFVNQFLEEPIRDFFSTEKFNRFNLVGENNNLSVFQGDLPHTTRFYIGEINNQLDIFQVIMRPSKLEEYSHRSYASKIIRDLFIENHIISFYSLREAENDNDSDLLYFYFINTPNFKSNLIINKLRENGEIVNQLQEKIETIDHLNEVKTFFDSTLYELKFKFKSQDMEPMKSTGFELCNEKIYFYLDLDAKFFSKGRNVNKDDEGKQILGETSYGNLKKYVLREITSKTVVEHLDSEEYRKFQADIRHRFIEEGYLDLAENPTIYDYWAVLQKIDISKEDKISIVSSASKFKENILLYPSSKLFIQEKEDILKTTRFNALQDIKRETYKKLKEMKSILSEINAPINILLLQELIPEYIDLMKYPFVVEFVNEKELELRRDQNDPTLLEEIPQEFMRITEGYAPLAGKYNFLLLPIVPNDLTKDEQEKSNAFLLEYKRYLFDYKLALNVEISDSIEYSWDKDLIKGKKTNIWAVNFDKEIKPKLIGINKDVLPTDTIIIALIGLRRLGTSSDIFKCEMENSFYLLQKNGSLSTLNFNVMQGYIVNEDYKYKAKKLAVISYVNALKNIANNNPKSNIAENIKQGIVFRSKYPFGIIDLENPISSIDMFSGFDASKVEGREFSQPRGATIVILDPYGKQLRSSYIENALTHSGVISERVVRELILQIYNFQELILNESFRRDSSEIKKGTLDYFLSNNPNLKRRILFVYDGKIYQKQKNTFLNVYRELIESKHFPYLPEIIFVEALKSHRVRDYLLGDRKVLDIPFGVMALLNDFEFLLKSHIWRKKSMAQPLIYRFKMKLFKNEGGILTMKISRDELINLGVQMFQTSLFNTGNSGRPLKMTKVLHESHKLSKEFAEKPDSIDVLWYKE